MTDEQQPRRRRRRKAENEGLAVEDDKNIGPRNTGTAIDDQTDEDVLNHVPAKVEKKPSSTLIEVTGTRPDGRVSFTEVHHRHPNGELVVIGSATAEAAPTVGVMQAIRDGRLTRN